MVFGILCVWWSIREEKRLNRLENKRLPKGKRPIYKKEEKCAQCFGRFYSRYQLVLCCDHKNLEEFREVNSNG